MVNDWQESPAQVPVLIRMIELRKTFDYVSENSNVK